MASTKTRAVFLVILAVCAYLTSETDAHLKIGKKEFRPMRKNSEDCFKIGYIPDSDITRTRNGSPELRKYQSYTETIAKLWKTRFVNIHLVFLGSTFELPAQSCQEIVASEGKEIVSGDYWIYSDGNDHIIVARCELRYYGPVIS
ncbi:hypothetical protein OS493_034933 [Desmophyllum pertusum]|uniref:Uncharacterized protein n=1 Tax=Desmophyllum pertusum TaxID=174260 RepID=A0A9X0CQ09_9CNID|nr:hypothetical protein OS493_034933 [Desmophyllum pertusum]